MINEQRNKFRYGRKSKRKRINPKIFRKEQKKLKIKKKEWNEKKFQGTFMRTKNIRIGMNIKITERK